jgi:hypothetical protein
LKYYSPLFGKTPLKLAHYTLTCPDSLVHDSDPCP